MTSAVPRNKNRTRPCAAIYRVLMMEFERRRLELGLPMDTNSKNADKEQGLNDLAGFADGYYAKIIYPDTPSGRQASWEAVDEFATALFGRDYSIQIIPGALNHKTLAALSEPSHASFPAISIRHWRHSRFFKELGKKGGEARAAKLSPRRRKAIARKANRASRRAKRQGEQHRAANAEKRAT